MISIWKRLKVGALWWKLGKRTDVEYLQGIIHGENVVIFKNERKMMPNDADFLVYRNTMPEEREKLKG